MGRISVAEGKAKFAALVRRAEAGEQILVTRNGKTVACIGPAPHRRPITYGDLAHLAPLFGALLGDPSLPPDVIDDFERALDKFAPPS